jgi:hypothetical protein
VNVTTTRALLASALVYAAAVALMGRHLLASLATTIGADIGDPVLVAATLAWNARTLPWTDAWFDFPAFHPATNVLTFTEHFLGVGVIASPLYWMTGDAIVTYNITLLASYVLTGVATFALVLRLTGSRAAAFIAGMAFGFAPYRASHLAHLQVGFVFWAPLALLGLHAYLDTGRRRWLALFGAAWLLQGASNGYFLIFFSVLVGCWTVWFLVLPGRWREVGWVLATIAVAALPLVPILARYLSAHAYYGFARNAQEIASFSADLAAVGCASRHLALWGWLRDGCAPEADLFPGVAVLLLCLGGAAAWLRPRSRERAWTRLWPAAACAGAAIVMLIVTAAAWNSSASFRISASSVGKPLSRAAAIAVLAAAWWFAAPRILPPQTRDRLVRPGMFGLLVGVAFAFLAAALSVAAVGPWQWTPRLADLAYLPSGLGLLLAVAAAGAIWRPWSAPSAVGFYVVGALVSWVLAWGPKPSAWGEPLLPQGPYEWLMWLPGMDGLRVPARFWMMTALCLSVAAGFAAAVLVRRSSRAAVAALVSVAGAGLLADGWATIPAATLLPSPPRPEALRGQVVMTLPVGVVRDFDIAAQYAAVVGGWRSVNGYSGYEPPHYELLRRTSDANNPAVLAPFVSRGDLHVIVAEGAASLRRMVEEQPGSVAVAAGPGWRQYRIPRQGKPQPRQPSGHRLRIASQTASCSEDLLPFTVDGDAGTRWHCGPQDPAQEIAVDLGAPSTVGQVVPALGQFATDYPRQLRVETSLDGRSWDAAWDGSILAELIEAQMHQPGANRYVLPFAPRLARYVRLRLQSSDNVWYWSIAELEVWSGPRE